MKYIVFTLFLILLGKLVPAQKPDKLDSLEWRFLGPIVGSRGSVVLGYPTEANVFFNGASNGLWKTKDAGIYWKRP